MKPVRYTPALITLLITLLFAGCSKDFSLELYEPPAPPPLPTTADDLKNIVINHQFQLRAFYSDIPVDYIKTDSEVKQETDLWSYVIEYLKDDTNRFTDNDDEVQVEQNAIKRPGLDDDILAREFGIGTDAEGIFMKFLDYQYNPLIYRVHEFTETYFILAVEWEDGATLFSRFEMLP